MKRPFFTRCGLALMRVLGRLPLPWLRAIGALLGAVLYRLASTRRHVVQTNLRLCFPNHPAAWHRQVARETFICFAQAWLDRGWLWHAPPEQVRKRLRLTGAVHELQRKQPTVVFAPHFVGMDAGWTAVTQALPRHFATIYTDQANKTVDAWIRAGRQRFGASLLFGRVDGVRPVLRALREGYALCLLPDMNFGPEESIFVPFYGVPAATVPSLSRFARLAHAVVVPVLTRITPYGYELEVLPAWVDFPGSSLEADTALMNQRLQSYINTMPAQYYWVHRRFKDRPAGQAPVY